MKWPSIYRLTVLLLAFTINVRVQGQDLPGTKSSSTPNTGTPPSDPPAPKVDSQTKAATLPGPVNAPSQKTDIASQPAGPSAGESNRELYEKIDRLQGAIEKLAKKSDDSSGWTAKDIAGLISAITTILAVPFSWRYVNVIRAMSFAQLRQNVRNEKSKLLQTKLDSFYGPLVQLRATSDLLYEIFRSRQAAPSEFRTLTALLSGRKFEGNDKILLDEIIKIGKQTENLILKSSGLVDDDIRPLLGQATTHYRILRLAYNDLLHGEPEKFEKHVYPRELDPSIEAKIRQIKDEIATLTNVNAYA